MSALNTHSKFYYGWQITTSNRYLDFNDGSDKVATLQVGTYSSAELATEIKKKMDAVSSLDFTVLFDRVTREFTILSTSNFSLLFSTGVNSGQSCAAVIGFNYADFSSATTYTSDFSSGYEYKTQFYIQSYKDTSTNRKAIDGVVNKSASGQVEVIKFGNERFMEAEFLFITNIIQPTNQIMRSSPTGVEDFINFIEWCTEKAPVEFMKNEGDVFSFQKFILESTPTDSKGLDYDLIETYGIGLPFYYKIGPLKFKLIT
jgi:hypothetical protein